MMFVHKLHHVEHHKHFEVTYIMGTNTSSNKGRRLLIVFLLLTIIPNAYFLIWSVFNSSGSNEVAGYNLITIVVLAWFCTKGNIIAKRLISIFQLTNILITSIMALSLFYYTHESLALIILIYTFVNLYFFVRFLGKGYLYDYVMAQKKSKEEDSGGLR